MNKQQKEVEKAKLSAEAKELKHLKTIYNKASKDIAKKINISNGKIEVLLQNWDDLTDEEKSIYQSQIYQRDFQKSLQKQIDGFLKDLGSGQYESISKYLEDCYETGFIGTMYDLHGQGIPLIMPIDQKNVVRAMQTNSKISTSLYKKLGENITTLKKRIANNLSRGIATADSYANIARNLAGESNIGFNRAMRIARTEGHRIQANSAFDAQTAAKDAGADVVKQWDAALDGRTRPHHRQLDGQIRELDEPFEVGGMEAMYPSNFGRASEDINCRCALLQRARWALDEEELQTLKDRAAYFGLDKTQSFEDFKTKYLKAEKVPQPKVKKEYLTEKKLKQNLVDVDADIEKLQNQLKNASDPALLKKIQIEIDEKELQKIDWEKKLNKKLATKEIKKLKKEKITLQEELPKLQDDISKHKIKTYSGIWKDDVTTADYGLKMAGIDGKKKYFENKILMAVTAEDKNKWQKLLDDTIEFEKEGAKFYALQQKIQQTEQRIKKIDNDVKKIKKDGIISGSKFGDAYTQERKDAAYWFTNQNGGSLAADKVLRNPAGEAWQRASKSEKDAIYEYTSSYHKFNEPLRGIEYGTEKYLGVGNVDMDNIGYWGKGVVKKLIQDMTSMIDKCEYDFDIWLNRGVRLKGMDKFFDIPIGDFSLPEGDLAAKLVGKTITEHGFLSCGTAKGKGFGGDIKLNIYAPKGTKMMYAEPFSSFGQGAGRSWDGISKQSSIGSESEIILQRGTKFRVTKVEKNNGTIWIDLEVIGQEVVEI